MTIEHRRADDTGWMCWIAMRFSQMWDFIDKRDIDKHTVTMIVLYGTVKIVRWSFIFAEAHMDKSGVELAAVIAAIIGPWSIVQTAAIKWYFDARST